MPQKKPKASTVFVPDLRKSNISFEKKITPITAKPTIENVNVSENKKENQPYSDIIEEETMKKKKPYTVRGKPHNEEDFVTPLPPHSHPTPPQLSNDLNEEETLKKKKSFNAKKPLFDDDDDEELDSTRKNNIIKPAVDNNHTQMKKKVLFSDSEDSEQNKSEEDSDEEDKKKKMEMKAKFNKAFLNKYD